MTSDSRRPRVEPQSLCLRAPTSAGPRSGDWSAIDSGCQRAACRNRRLMAEWSRPVFGTSRPEAASQDQVLNVSKLASNSSDGGPALGHRRTFTADSLQEAQCPRRTQSESPGWRATAAPAGLGANCLRRSGAVAATGHGGRCGRSHRADGANGPGPPVRQFLPTPSRIDLNGVSVRLRGAVEGANIHAVLRTLASAT